MLARTARTTPRIPVLERQRPVPSGTASYVSKTGALSTASTWRMLRWMNGSGSFQRLRTPVDETAVPQLAGRGAAYPPAMRFYFDESGNFEFPEDRFEAYTQAVIICADSRLPRVETWIAQARKDWSVAEIHGVDLTDNQCN
jgi:hypothetical protein